jgi:CheY-like chemotaxis protein
MVHKLLLADDSVTIQRVIELTFADEDVEVTTVGDGQMAIDRLDADPPDIILADVDMPKRDGYEVAAYVKSRPTLAHIPVVLLTGAFEPIDQARAAAAGSSDVLAKPFEPQMVINRVKELLGKNRQDDGGAFESPQQNSRETWPQMGDPQPASRQTPADGQQAVSLDDYFDQLDAAFSNLQPGAPPANGSDDMNWSASPPPDTAASPVSAPTPMPDKPAPLPAVASAPTLSGGTAPAFAHNAPADKPFDQPIITNAQNAPAFAADAADTAGTPIASTAPAFAADAAAATEPIAPIEIAPNAVIAPIAPVSPVAPHPLAFSPPVAPPAPQPAASANPVSAPRAPVAPEGVAPGAVVAPAPDLASAFAPDAAGTAGKPSVPVAPDSPSTPMPNTPGTTKPAVNPFASLSAAKAEAAARPVAPVVTEEMIEDIVSRVLQRLSDRVVRETVTDIVSQTAERLVQEEIERIRSGS